MWLLDYSLSAPPEMAKPEGAELPVPARRAFARAGFESFERQTPRRNELCTRLIEGGVCRIQEGNRRRRCACRGVTSKEHRRKTVWAKP